LRTRTILAGITGLSAVFFALGAAWYFIHMRPPEYCQLSGRLIHPHMLTSVRVNGKKLYACCARCALTYEQQTGKQVEIISVTDYISGQQIDAHKAYFVSDSQVEPCSSPSLQREEGGIPYFRLFDRCSPSLIAFALQDQARAFVDERGGALTTLNELHHRLKSADHGANSSRSQP
jgi:hypothetical protein